MNYRKINDEVYYSTTKSVSLDRSGIAFLKSKAAEGARARARLCAHWSPEDILHEMFIIHHNDTFVRPHKHLHKQESFHLIEGDVDVVLFDDAGKVTDVISMGNYDSGKPFYYRIVSSCFHTFIIRSEVLVFHEITTGPFNREEAAFAPWAPDGTDAVAVKDYMNLLCAGINDRFK